MSNKTNLQIPISRFALITRISQDALRLYDKIGILKPSRDPINNYRYYSSEQIEKGLKIKILSWMGFSLKEIDEILQNLKSEKIDFKILDQQFKQRLANTQLEMERLKKVEEILKGKTAMEVLFMKTTEPTIKNIPKIRVVSKREKGEIVQLIGKLMGELMQFINHPDNQRGQVSICGAPMMMCHDQIIQSGLEGQDIDIENTEIEVAIPITGKIITQGDYEVKFIEEAKVVSVIHTGSYNDIEGAYVKAYDYIKKKGYKVSDLCREIYLSNPQEVPDDELLTEIQVPITSN